MRHRAIPRSVPPNIPAGARLHVITAAAPPLYFVLPTGAVRRVADGGKYLDSADRKALKGARPLHRAERRAAARAKGVRWPVGGWSPAFV